MPDLATDPFAGQPDPFAGMVPAAPPKGGPSAPVAAAPGGDPWAGQPDPFSAMTGPEAKPAEKPGWKRVAAQIGAAGSDVIATGLGWPVDLVTGELNRIARRARNGQLGPGDVPLEDRFWALPRKPDFGPAFGGSESIKKAMGLIGANPDELPANTTPERIARGVGTGLMAAVAPEMMVGTAARTGAAVPQMAKTLFGAADSVPRAAANAFVGATSGAGGQAAAELVPEKWKPAAQLAGGLAGGGIGAALTAVPRMAGIGIDAMGRYFEPLTEAGRQKLAGRTLAAGAENPAGTLDTLQNVGAPELVPGSKPTTFQATGDIGLGSMERAAETEAPAVFNQRRAEQNAARVEALGQVEPHGSAHLVPQFLKQHLADLDARTQAAVDAAATGAQAKAAALPGVGEPAEFGSAIRGAITDAKATVKTDERALWQAVDPKGDLALDAAPVRQAATRITQELPSTAKPLSGEEKAIVETAAGMRGVVPFSDITALRSRVTDAMREELRNNGETQTYRRLTQLRGSVEDAISQAVEGKAAQESKAVASGAMSAEDTMAASLHRRTEEWRAARQAEAGQDLRASAGDGSAARATPVAGPPGASLSERGQPGDSAGNQGVQGSDPLVPNFNQAAKERLAAASAATKARAQTFNQGPVGDVLRTQGAQGNFRVMDSAVGPKFFRPGPTGGQTVQKLIDAVGPQKALDTLADHAANRLRATAMDADGTVNPAKLEGFLKSHAEALKAFPALKAQFADAAKATEAIGQAAAARKAALDDFQQGAIGNLLKVSEPGDVVKTVGSIFGRKDAIETMRRLAQTAKTDPDAMQGLRRAIAEHIEGKFISNREAGTSEVNAMRGDQFQTFIRNNKPVLAQAFTSDEIKGMEAIAKDVARSNRSIDAVKLPGRSNTAQDLAAAEKPSAPGHHEQKGSILNQMILAGGAGYAAHGEIGAVTGALGAAGRYVLGGMRAAGMNKVDDLVQEMLLHPDLARAGLELAAKQTAKQPGLTFAQTLARITAINASRSALSAQR